MKNKIPTDSNFEPPKPKGRWTWRTLNKNFLQIKKPTTGKGIPKKGHSFGEIYPNIAKEFYTEWNGGTSPNDYRSGSKVVVFWKCPFGHIYPAAIGNRVQGQSCPICAKQRPSRDRNFQVLYPDIASQWHPILNGRWLPQDFLPGSDAKAAWLCPNNSEHIWVCPIKHRTYMKSGCPYCYGGTSRAEMRLMAELQALFGCEKIKNRIRINNQEVDLFITLEGHPAICIEFDGAFYHQNKKKTDDAKLNNLEMAGNLVIRLRGAGLQCPRDLDALVSYSEECEAKPELAFKMATCLSKALSKETKYYAEVTRYLKNKQILNEKGFQKLIRTMHKPNEGRSLLDKCPEIIHIWSEKNIRQPKDISYACNDYFYLKCDVCGYEWSTSANSLSRGSGCRRCADKATSERLRKCSYKDSLLANCPELVNGQWDYKLNKKVLPDETAIASNQIVWWRCISCGKPFKSMVQNRVKSYLNNNKSGCLECFGIGVVYVFKHIKTGEQVEATNAEMVEKYDLSAGSLSSVINKSRSSHKGWVCLGKKGEKQRDISTIKVTKVGERYHFLNLDTGEKFTGTQDEMWKKYGLIQSDVSAICRGKFKTTKNWICLGVFGENPRDVSNIKRSTKGDIHTFKNLKTGEKISATFSQMAKRYKLHHSGFSFLKSGRIKTYKNWIYLGSN